MNKLEIRDISKSFSPQAKSKDTTRLQVLSNISLTLGESEFLTIIGPSGCGKTTLLRIIAGLEKPDSGDVFIDGKKVEGPGRDRGFVFQGFNLLPWRTVRGNVEFGLELQGVPENERARTAADFIRFVGLERFENHHPHQLSGGMQQRVGIARALSVDPKILLMDEPYGSLDAQTRELMQDELLKLLFKRPKSVVFITHGIDEAIYLSDRVVVLSSRPGAIQQDVRIELKKPRYDYDARADRKFHEYRSLLKKELTSKSFE